MAPWQHGSAWEAPETAAWGGASTPGFRGSSRESKAHCSSGAARTQDGACTVVGKTIRFGMGSVTGLEIIFLFVFSITELAYPET